MERLPQRYPGDPYGGYYQYQHQHVPRGNYRPPQPPQPYGTPPGYYPPSQSPKYPPPPGPVPPFGPPGQPDYVQYHGPTSPAYPVAPVQPPPIAKQDSKKREPIFPVDPTYYDKYQEGMKESYSKDIYKKQQIFYFDRQQTDKEDNNDPLGQRARQRRATNEFSVIPPYPAADRTPKNTYDSVASNNTPAMAVLYPKAKDSKPSPPQPPAPQQPPASPMYPTLPQQPPRQQPQPPPQQPQQPGYNQHARPPYPYPGYNGYPQPYGYQPPQQPQQQQNPLRQQPAQSDPPKYQQPQQQQNPLRQQPAQSDPPKYQPPQYNERPWDMQRPPQQPQQQQNPPRQQPAKPEPPKYPQAQYNERPQDMQRQPMRQNIGAESTICKSSEFNQLFQQMRAANRKFRDKQFPATQRSIIGDGSNERALKWANAEWLSPDDFWGPGTYKVFDKIEVNDIIQGELGNCYFLSTLSSLAEWEHRVKRLFISHQANAYGIYGVYMCEQGEWKEVIIDDLFPCFDRAKGPIFTRGNGRELWVLILEKAWAKLHGSYERIETGFAREVLHDLTGAPTLPIFMDDPQLVKWILDGEKNNWIMTAGSDELEGTEPSQVNRELGLVSTHAYSLLSAHEIRKPNETIHLVKLRNPWSKVEWNGAWSDESPLWTTELRQRFNHYPNRNDGIFFMAINDFKKYFHDVQICMVNDAYKYNSVRGTSTMKRGVYVRIVVTKESLYYFTVNQHSKRKFGPRSGYRYSFVKMLLGRKTGGTYTYVSSKVGCEKEVWVSGKLPPGEYLLYFRVYWFREGQMDYVLSSYGGEPVIFDFVQKVPDYFRSVVLDKARQTQSKRKDYRDDGHPNCIRCVEFTESGFGYVYYYNGSNRRLIEEIKFISPEGLSLVKPYAGTEATVQVPPGREEIVLVKLSPDGFKFNIEFKSFFAN